MGDLGMQKRERDKEYPRKELLERGEECGKRSLRLGGGIVFYRSLPCFLFKGRGSEHGEGKQERIGDAARPTWAARISFFLLSMVEIAAAASIELAGLRSPFPSYASSAVPRRTPCWPLFCPSRPCGRGCEYSNTCFPRVAETVDLMEARGTAMGDTDFVKGGKTVIAFIKDPDYYKFELLERAPKP
ncbi:hypothetical protein MUK42_30145 [Musa troglodytarum]|uniref:Lactoylglutathione lyase n=1 Tax=Musa troglodytarum TaxID=320322 RepID=A0A9E7JPP6_9LILI|nr:hypothetical protein MUK42_30145 [Musa troglodytarum]